MIKSKELFNIKSPKQIADFLYNHLNLTVIKRTPKEGISTDESVITHHAEKDNIQFCKFLMWDRKLEKALNTYLADVLRNITLDKKIHPDFWLNTTETFRSSSSSPNYQNQPAHGYIIESENIKILWNIIRKVFISLIDINPNYILLEGDYEGAEVKTAANLSEDTQLIKDLNNNLDMHSHWTNVIFGWNYQLPEIKEKFSEERYLIKNTWTFANFYGAGPQSMAEEFRKFEVYKKFVKEKYKHITKDKNFDKFFEEFSIKHIEQCQQVFYERYFEFKAWQDKLVKDYYNYGYVETPLGFRRNYPLKRNEILNFPIQATSFHILLNACIQIQKELIKYKFKSKIAAQIHDSIFIHAYLPELYDLLEICDDKMINHDLPIAKKAKLNTEWAIGKNWQSMKKLPMIERNKK